MSLIARVGLRSSCSATLGVATVSYAPLASFDILCPPITVARAYAGLRRIRVDESDGQTA